MNKLKLLQSMRLLGSVGVACALLSASTTARANCYATDIKINGIMGTTPVAAPEGGYVTISYILNEAATGGVTVNITDVNNNPVDAITIASANQGTLRGSNSVVWGLTNSAGAPVSAGNYTVAITAVGAVYSVWTQTSVDDSPGTPAHYPLGIAVDNNTNSPYYGRVIVGCALNTGTVNVPTAAMKIGLFKNNADGTQADEGWFGYAGYSVDDGADNQVAGEMAASGGYEPMKIRVGEDDRIYFVDNSYLGAIVACDMEATTNQMIINEGPTSKGYPNYPNNYSGNPDYSDLSVGIQQFDVAITSPSDFSTNLAGYYGVLLLGDGDFPNWGIWMYHMVGGVADPADTVGTQAVFAGTGSDIALVANGGMMIDTNLDIFCGQARQNTNADYFAMDYPNWNGGILPPEGGSFNYALLTQVSWAYGCGVNTTCDTAASEYFEAVEDTVINSRTHPTVVACPLGEGSQTTSGGGIRLLNAATGAILTAGTTVYTNLDYKEAYTCAAFDNVGNLYAASTTRNVWRVYSPPNTNANTNTTVAVEQVAVQAMGPTITQALPLFRGTLGGSAQSLTAKFDGTAPLSVQWYQVAPGGSATAVSSGEFTTSGYSSTLTLTGLTSAQNGAQYYAVVTDANSLTAQSASSTLAVYGATPPALVSFASTLGLDATNGWNVNGTGRFITPGVLRLTDGNGSEAGSAFYSQPVNVNGFVATFTYTCFERGTPADGLTFCIQPQAPTENGTGGGDLGVTGITPSVELELNIYPSNGKGGVGMGYATDGNIATVSSTSPVLLTNGNPVNVTIVYTNAVMWVNLLDTATGNTYSRTFNASSNNIPSILGTSTAYVGFTAADGGSAAYQTVQNFLFQSITNQVVSTGPLSGGQLPLAWTPAAFSLVQSTSAQGPWTPVTGLTITTNIATGQAYTTVTPTGPTQFYSIIAP